MLDIKFIRENADLVRDGARKKHFEIDVDRLLSLDEERRKLITRSDELKAEMNVKSKSVSKASPDERPALVGALKSLKEEIKNSDDALRTLEEEFQALMLKVPNVPDPDVPEGEDDQSNEEIRREGEIPDFDFEPLDHIELGKRLDIIDIERGAMVAGSRNYMLKGAGEMLHRAVLSLAMDLMVGKGFVPLQVPVLVKDFAMVGTGFYPYGEDQVYRTEKEGLNLIGTAEVPVTSMHQGEIFKEEDLPLYYVAQTTCFRREAGAAGRDTRGLYRVHQFQKVEQVVICRNDRDLSEKEHNSILQNAEELMQMLGLPYRVVNVCGGDLGLPQAKKYDIEAWMPSRDSYGETHSASKFFDYQARRLMMRYKDDNRRIHYAHTLNNTVAASPRLLIPLLEIHQAADGSVHIPEALRPYMGGMERIKT
ncbi:MAG: serine--tRNA ligase [Planctomycetota bacterium]|jgi:seryl-tRNA synthetase